MSAVIAKPEPVTPVVIAPPNIQRAKVTIKGTAPLMQLAFSEKAQNLMAEKMTDPTAGTRKKQREARDFAADAEAAMHRSTEGWIGVPAAAIRNACIDACRVSGFKMTIAKMSIFVMHDGLDRVDGQPLLKLKAGTPEITRMAVRNATGVADLRVRPMWREWSIDLRLEWDGDQFRQADVINLLARAGMQVGIGEGRPYSKTTAGLGYGTFVVV